MKEGRRPIDLDLIHIRFMVRQVLLSARHNAALISQMVMSYKYNSVCSSWISEIACRIITKKQLNEMWNNNSGVKIQCIASHPASYFFFFCSGYFFNIVLHNSCLSSGVSFCWYISLSVFWVSDHSSWQQKKKRPGMSMDYQPQRCLNKCGKHGGFSATWTKKHLETVLLAIATGSCAQRRGIPGLRPWSNSSMTCISLGLHSWHLLFQF